VELPRRHRVLGVHHDGRHDHERRSHDDDQREPEGDVVDAARAQQLEAAGEHPD
jgi:hypothetical protein